MKKQSLLWMAGVVITLASCQDNSNETSAMDQARIDSAVNARTEEMRLQMMAQNDSIINAEAQRRADSMIAASADNTAEPASRTVKPTTTKTGTTKSSGGTKTTTAPVTPKSAQDEKFEQRESGTKTITDEKKKEQDDKFKKRGG
jgi:hypothetical protein